MGISIVVLYSILVYASYGIDCQGPINQSNYFKFNGNITATQYLHYYVGCSLDTVTSSVRIIVTDLSDNSEVLNALDGNVSYSNHYFYALENHDYSIYVGTSSTPGWALCEPTD